MRWMTAGAAASVALAVARSEAPRTAWGDPDLHGHLYERQLDRRAVRAADVSTASAPQLTDEEYSAQASTPTKSRSRRTRIRLPESEFSAEDPSAINASRHWLERPEVPSRATSLVVDPPNGRLPELTPAGQQRLAERRARRGRGLPASYTDFTQLRPLPHARPRRLDRSRHLRQRHADRASARRRRDPQRDDP